MGILIYMSKYFKEVKKGAGDTCDNEDPCGAPFEVLASFKRWRGVK